MKYIVICLFLLGASIGRAQSVSRTDSCLMAQPLEQRYKGENLKLFVAHIERIDAEAVTDLLKNWKNLPLAQEEQGSLVKKTENLLTSSLFMFCVQKQSGLNFREYLALIEKAEMPLARTVVRNLRFVSLLQQKDIDGIIQATRELTAAALSGSTMEDWVVLGHSLLYVLENANMEQCKETKKILDDILKDKTDEDLYTLVKMRDDLEGRIMMMEMGEE